MTKIRNTQNHIIIYAIIVTFILLMLALTVRNKVDAGPLNSTDWYVPDDFPDIQAALNSVSSGDVVWVRPGVYDENLDYMGKAVAVRSTDGPEVTTILVNGGTAVSLGGPGAEIVGFTITGGIASFGAGISVSGLNTLIKDNIIEFNLQTAGGAGAGILGNVASPVIDSNIFRGNSCDGQYASGVLSFLNSSSPIITNNIIENNPCRGINMTLPVSGAPLVMNNTLNGNDVGIRVDRRIDSINQIYRNNIIVNNDIGLEVDFGSEADNPVWENNLVYGNLINYEIISDQTGINGNISVDPEFLDSEYHLITTSPAVNTGSNTGCPVTDFNGDPRPQGTICDMGAYEVIYTEATFSPDQYIVMEGETAVFTITLGTALPVSATVDYKTVSGSAISGTDFTPAVGTLLFDPGTTTGTFTSDIIDDGVNEPTENFVLILFNAQSQGAFVEGNDTAIVTIPENFFTVYLPVMRDD